MASFLERNWGTVRNTLIKTAHSVSQITVLQIFVELPLGFQPCGMRISASSEIVLQMFGRVGSVDKLEDCTSSDFTFWIDSPSTSVC